MRRERKKHEKKRGFILALGVVVGLAFILYPFLSQVYYDQVSSTAVDDFRAAVEAITSSAELDEKLDLANAYNEALEPNLSWVDPYSEDEREEGIMTYAKMLELQEKIGVVNIPTIDVSLPVYAGTSERVLQEGVGHLEGTSLPVGGENTHSVLTAHRGLPEARLFTDLDKMEVGDLFFVETMAGELYYEVDQIIVVEPTEVDSVMIVEGEDHLTLLTCTPYMINSHRLLVRGKRVPNPPAEVVEELHKDEGKGFLYYLQTYWYYFVIIFVAIVTVGIIVKRQKKND